MDILNLLPKTTIKSYVGKINEVVEKIYNDVSKHLELSEGSTFCLVMSVGKVKNKKGKEEPVLLLIPTVFDADNKATQIAITFGDTTSNCFRADKLIESLIKD